MLKHRFRSFLLLLHISVAVMTNAAIMQPNPIISLGNDVEVAVSSGDGSGINDKKFGYYADKRWEITDDSWVAVKVTSGTYSHVFFIWNCPDTSWSDAIGIPEESSCSNGVKIPVDYEILTSANSTDGSDGDWETAVTVEGNTVAARGHMVEFSGASWIKMHITAGTGRIDEIEVFDVTNDHRDTWFFLGSKITALMYKGPKSSGYTQRDKSPPDSNFAKMINNRNPEYFPAVVRGGVFCELTSGDVVRDLSKYLEVAGNMHFWAIELGTYDAWGGGNENAAEFQSNLQIIVDSCRNNGIEPIISRICSTNPQSLNPSWQIHGDFLKAVDDVTEENDLIPGADFYAYFSTTFGKMDLGNDGVLPNNYGDFEMQREWNLKMDTVVYKADPVSVHPVKQVSGTAVGFAVHSENGQLVLTTARTGTVSVFSTDGRCLSRKNLSATGMIRQGYAPGVYVVRFSAPEHTASVKVLHY